MIRLLTLSLFFVSHCAFAGGSISREDALAFIVRRDAVLASVFSELRPDAVGHALRRRDGSRTFPFEFAGKSRNGGLILITVDETENGSLALSVETAKGF